MMRDDVVNFYKHYLGDYSRKTAHLTLLEHGAYLILLQHYYATLTPLPAPIETLHRICRAITQVETQAVSQVVSQFFPLSDDGLRHNSRADQEILAWKAIAERNRNHGKLGGRPKTQMGVVKKPSPEVRSQKLEVRNQKPETIKDKYKAQNGFTLPDWVPKQQWDMWLEARAKMRKSPTERAKHMAVNRLDELRQLGYSPAAVLAESAFNNWTGLFPLKDQK